MPCPECDGPIKKQVCVDCGWKSPHFVQKNPHNWKGQKKYFHRCDSPTDRFGNEGQCWNMLTALTEFPPGYLGYCWFHQAKPAEVQHVKNLGGE